MSHEPEMIFLVLDSFINLAMNTNLLDSRSCFLKKHLTEHLCLQNICHMAILSQSCW